MSGALLAGPVILAAQLVAMYVLGSYAMSAFGSVGAASGMPCGGKALFYLLVAPGVICHESAHYLACKLTATPVGKFRPFAPSTDPSGRTALGYVTHASRGPVIRALIGLAPVVVNPAALVALTVLMTPVEVVAGSPLGPGAGVTTGLSSEGVIAVIGDLGQQVGAFAASEPAFFLFWAYLGLSLALGSVPSREDLVAVPAAAALVAGGGLLYASVFGGGFLVSISAAASYGISLYLLPLGVSAVAAAVGALLRY